MSTKKNGTTGEVRLCVSKKSSDTEGSTACSVAGLSNVGQCANHPSIDTKDVFNTVKHETKTSLPPPQSRSWPAAVCDCVRVRECVSEKRSSRGDESK